MTLHEAAVIAAQADLSRFPYLSSEEVREALRILARAATAFAFEEEDEWDFMDPTSLPN